MRKRKADDRGEYVLSTVVDVVFAYFAAAIVLSCRSSHSNSGDTGQEGDEVEVDHGDGV